MVNKTELINAAAEAAQVTKKDAAAVVNAVLDTIAQTLADGDKVQLVGFGNFEIRERKARQGKNPRTPYTFMLELPAAASKLNSMAASSIA